MAEVRAVPDADRLPWLSNDVQPVRRRRTGVLLAWPLAAAALVGGMSYWLGTDRDAAPDAPTEMTGRLSSAAPAGPIGTAAPAESIEPEPVPQAPIDQLEPTRLPLVQPAPEPPPVAMRTVEAPSIPEPAQVAVAEPGPEQQASETPGEEAAAAAVTPQVEGNPAPQTASVQPPLLQKPQPVVRTPLRPWPAAQSTGAAGRMVRIGTFASRYQAKRAWWRVIRTYPGLRRLKAVVVPFASVRNGRTYYRLQFGTTSHAHSVVLCQRMRIVGQSCVPVGLPSGQSRA